MASESQTFGLDIAKFVEKAKAAPEQVVRKVGLDLAASIVRKSPVDTGRFRANWNVAFGQIDPSVSHGADKTGSATLARANIVLDGWQGGQDIYLTNSLPYAIPLEYGHSDQAPNGMVRLTVTEFQTFVNRAVAELPK